MKTVSDLSELRRKRKPLFLAAGYFDGIHLGHRKVIDATLRRARQQKGQAWVLTFETHPLRVLNPPQAPLLLTSTPHRLLLLERLGVDGCVLLPFDRKLARLTPEQFAAKLRHCVPPLREVFVGRNWRFGRNGEGNPALLSRAWKDIDCWVNVVRPVVRGGETVSSSRVRAAILRGRLAEASRLLGRPFGILGTVVRGRGVGRELGFPTANLDPHGEVLPPWGIYAARALVDGRLRDGVVSFGVRPSFQPAAERERRAAAPRNVPVLELHILGSSDRLYGKDVEIFFFQKLRNEHRFDTREALVQQIGKDCAESRSVLRSRAGRDLSQKLKECLYTG